jgi:hypothetical protein
MPAVLSKQWLHLVVVPLLLLMMAGLAVASLVGDSVTFDETSAT